MDKKKRLQGFRAAALACAAAALCAAAAVEPVKVTVEARPDASYSVEGAFEVEASSQAAWSVISDYEALPKLVPYLKASEIVEREPDGVVVEQLASGRVLFLRRTSQIRLRIHETPFSEITFADVSDRDFKSFAGTWSLRPLEKGVRVEYILEALPKFSAPTLIVKWAFRNFAFGLLKGVRR
jgi:ribosome-associated toxin RatA of RatAB toxin-antitoxin module